MGKPSLTEPRSDIYRSITTRIIQAIEAGAGDFVMPWHLVGPRIGRPTNASTGNAYRGGNVVALWAESMLAGYGSGHWATYRQWSQLGAQVRRGEKAAAILFFKTVEPKEAPGSVEEEQRKRWLARASSVFNADQVDGWKPPALPLKSLVGRVTEVEAFIAKVGAHVRHGGDVACYRLREDRIDMPPKVQFVGTPTSTPTESYYATLLHEHVHWSGATHRLNRTFGTSMQDEQYAREELIAELGAAFLCSDLGIANDPRPDHAAYLGHWLSVLRADPRALFTAAREASEAAQFLTGIEPP